MFFGQSERLNHAATNPLGTDPQEFEKGRMILELDQ
jgi:hypothetical protein